MHLTPLDIRKQPFRRVMRGFDPDAVEAAVQEVRDLARVAKVGIVLGAHLPFAGGWSNSALLIGPSGRVLGRYDKAHLYARDPEFYRAGRERPSASPFAHVPSEP